MAVLEMKRFRLIGMKKDRRRFLTLLQRTGALEVHEVRPPRSKETEDAPDSEPNETPVFSREDLSQELSECLETKRKADQALSILEKYSPSDKGIRATLSGRNALDSSEYDEMRRTLPDIEKTADQVLSLEKEHQEAKSSLVRLTDEKTSLTPWLPMASPLSFAGTRTTDAFTGSVPAPHTKEEILEVLSDVPVSIVSEDPNQICIRVLCRKQDANDVKEHLRLLDFAELSPELRSEETAEALSEKISKELAQTKDLLIQKEDQIKAMSVNRNAFYFLSDECAMNADRIEAAEKMLQSRHVFVLEGYVPAKAEKALTEELGKISKDIVCEFQTPSADEDVPVILKNNGFSAPVEGVVESYSLPGKGERDPSSMVAIFYYILFGFMLSDAGYGLILIVATTILLAKYKNMEAGLKKTLRMLQYCGIATTVVGFLTGSFFGNAVNSIADTFFNRPDITLPALWMDPLNQPMKMLGVCFIIGIIHLFFGLGIKMVDEFRSGHWKDAVCDGVLWYFFVGGLILLLLTYSMVTDMFGSEPIPVVFRHIGAVLALVGFVGIVLTAGRESRNWFKRILKGLYGAYGISSWLSDILSYSRLLALGLATGVIGQVFNTMAGMVAKGRGVFGVVIYIVIFIIGHTLNLLINALGAYVHTNRLTFVEFFGKFYEGGGRKFKPLTENTKYYVVK